MRIPRHMLYMKIARCMSERSTCHRLNVGAVITLDHNIVSCGYNGPPAGEEHCRGNDCPLNSATGGCTRSFHAERNALERVVALRRGDYRLYVTHSPCSDCARNVVEFTELIDLKEVFYEVEYRDTEPIRFLIDSGIGVFRVTPSGYLIDKSNDQIVLPE